jgi:hypothetical protein
MGITVARLAMGGRSSVGDPRRALEALRQNPFEVANAALALGEMQFVRPNYGDPGRVVPTVFKPMQPFHEDRCCVAPTDITDDPAHSLFSSAVDQPPYLPFCVLG